MSKYYPYVVLETNVNPLCFKYRIYIYNAVKNYAQTSILFTSNELKKVGNNLYQTRAIEIDGSKMGMENLRDCVLIFDLYRLSSSGQEALVIERYIVPDKIELFVSPSYNPKTNITKVKYNEANYVTKVVNDEKTKNTFQLTLTRNRIFQCMDPGCRPGEAKDPFSKPLIEAGLQARLNEPFPDQDRSSLCGPAAYFFCLINLSPTSYKIAVKQLWETGRAKIGQLDIKPSIHGSRRVKNFYKKSNGYPNIPPIDWITLASLRESENLALTLNDPEQEVAGITTPMELERWYRKSGFRVIASYPIQMGGYSLDFISKINKYAGPDHFVVTLISASLLSSGTSSGTQIFPDHWIVWTDKLRDTNGQPISEFSDPYSTEVRLKMFTWGENTQRLGTKISLYTFKRKVFFALIIKKENF